MKTARTMLVALAFVGCSSESPPLVGPTRSGTGSPEPLPAILMVWGAVVDESGLCIIGATVEIVSGQGLGTRMTQATLCDAWEPYGGFVFNGLTGVITLRASATGYVAREVTVMPSGVPVIVDLSKVPGTAAATIATTE